MNRILHFLFPAKIYSASESWFLWALRILFGVLFMSHGIAKWSAFGTLSDTFPDPLGFGRHTTMLLAVFTEIICSAGFIAGAFYRLALIPMILTLFIAFFIIHGGDPFTNGEQPFIYLTVFVLMFITGPGRYALDRVIGPGLTAGRTRRR